MRKIGAPHSGSVFVSGSLNDRRVSPNTHQQNQQEPPVQVWAQYRGGLSSWDYPGSRAVWLWQSPSNTGIHAEPGLRLERVHLCFMRCSHFLKSTRVSIGERGAALGWVVCAFIRSPGLGKCLRWGHVRVPGKWGAIDRLQRAAPPAPRIPRSCRRRSAGSGPASEPICHQMSPSAASASDSPAHNVPSMLNTGTAAPCAAGPARARPEPCWQWHLQPAGTATAAEGASLLSPPGFFGAFNLF